MQVATGTLYAGAPVPTIWERSAVANVLAALALEPNVCDQHGSAVTQAGAEGMDAKPRESCTNCSGVIVPIDCLANILAIAAPTDQYSTFGTAWLRPAPALKTLPALLIAWASVVVGFAFGRVARLRRATGAQSQTIESECKLGVLQRVQPSCAAS